MAKKIENLTYELIDLNNYTNYDAPLKQLIADLEYSEGRRITLDEISSATGIHRTRDFIYHCCQTDKIVLIGLATSCCEVLIIMLVHISLLQIKTTMNNKVLK